MDARHLDEVWKRNTMAIIGLNKGRTKSANGKPYDELTDDEVDELLAGLLPKKTGYYASPANAEGD